MMQYSQSLTKAFLLLLSLVVLLWPALYNAFPLVNPDSGAYISSGLRLSVHPDRPIGYGLFVLLTSMGISLWFVVVAQALILNWLIRRLTQKLLGKHADGLLPAIVLLLISFGTTVSWFTAQLTPDIFTAALLLCVLLFFLERNDRKKSRTYGIVMFFLFATHNSNVVIALALSLLLMLYTRRKALRGYFIAARKMFLVALSSFAVLSSIYMFGGYGFGLSPVTHVFLVSRMAENGILDQYLEEECPVTHYSLCDYQGKLGVRQWDFMWGAGYPHNKLGWMETRKEYNRIILGTLASPRLLGLHVLKSLEGTARELPQLFLSDALTPEGAQSNTYKNVELYFRHQLKEYQTSMQSNNILQSPAQYNNLLIVLFTLATGIAALAYSRQRITDAVPPDGPDWALLFGITILFLVLNAWVTSTFATVVARFQARVFWVLPLLCLLYVISCLRRKVRLLGE